eukprot:TRINITY_DN75381_c0_g1_i1.p1 TRINITY_DN75381_c0_g1~~TRINITY_DN75381_c0_g1_i1.p1  ORF type:complete len:149 (+),score=84.55 TRINITY_DN75381_c0_g1_i1:49-495(+)
MSLSNEQVEELKEVFSVYDNDNTDKIAIKDLGACFRSLGVTLNQYDEEQMIQEVDPAGTGEVTFERFQSLMEKKMKHIHTVDEIVEAFKVFDKDGSGLISADDIKGVLTKIGTRPLSDAEMKEMLASADPNSTGRINYRDFVKRTLDD